MSFPGGCPVCFCAKYSTTIWICKSCDLLDCSGCKGRTDFGKRKAKTLRSVPFIGHTSDFFDKILFFIVCAGPAHVVFPAERKENIIINAGIVRFTIMVCDESYLLVTNYILQKRNCPHRRPIVPQGMPAKRHRAFHHHRRPQSLLLPRPPNLGNRARLPPRHMRPCPGPLSASADIFSHQILKSGKIYHAMLLKSC